MKGIICIIFILLCKGVIAQEAQPLLPVRKTSGFYGNAQVGCITGDARTIGISAGAGYHFRFGLETGISIGRETYMYTYSPLLLETNYSFSIWKSIKPFVGIYGGSILNMSPHSYYRGKPTNCFGVRIGFTRHLTEHLGWTTSIGYRFMELYEPVYYLFDMMPYNPQVVYTNKHTMELRIGLELR